MDGSINVEGAEVAKNVRNASSTVNETEIYRLDGHDGTSGRRADSATKAAVGQLVIA